VTADTLTHIIREQCSAIALCTMVILSCDAAADDDDDDDADLCVFNRAMEQSV